MIMFFLGLILGIPFGMLLIIGFSVLMMAGRTAKLEDKYGK
jgi:hypothetical protein